MTQARVIGPLMTAHRSIGMQAPGGPACYSESHLDG